MFVQPAGGERRGRLRQPGKTSRRRQTRGVCLDVVGRRRRKRVGLCDGHGENDTTLKP